MFGSDPANGREHGMRTTGIDHEAGLLLHPCQERVEDIGRHPPGADTPILGGYMHLRGNVFKTFYDARRRKTFFVLRANEEVCARPGSLGQEMKGRKAASA